MKLDPANLAAHLAGRLLPVYHLCGDEPLLAGEAADEIRDRARAEGFVEREVHFIERGGGWDEVQAAAATLSLFAARKILEIRMPTGKAGASGAKILARIVESARDDLLILVFTGRLDRETQAQEWVRAIESHGAVVSLATVEPARLPAWLAERCRRAGLEADAEALELLAARTEGNLLAARQEIEKLRLLVGSGRLDAAAVLASVADSARFEVGELARALGARDAGRALRVLDGLRAEGVELPLVLWVAVRELRAHGRGRASRADQARLCERAVRVDRMLKGHLAGDAWDELALLAAEACGLRTFSLPSRRQA